MSTTAKIAPSMRVLGSRQTMIWRDRTFRNWTVNPENLTVYCPSYSYEIDLKTCSDSAQILDWIFQLLTKAWMTEESMTEFLLLIMSILDPQRNFCSLGVEQGPLPSSKLKTVLRKNINGWILEHSHNNDKGQIYD